MIFLLRKTRSRIDHEGVIRQAELAPDIFPDPKRRSGNTIWNDDNAFGRDAFRPREPKALSFGENDESSGARVQVAIEHPANWTARFSSVNCQDDRACSGDQRCDTAGILTCMQVCVDDVGIDFAQRFDQARKVRIIRSAAPRKIDYWHIKFLEAPTIQPTLVHRDDVCVDAFMPEAGADETNGALRSAARQFLDEMHDARFSQCLGHGIDGRCLIHTGSVRRTSGAGDGPGARPR